MRVLVAGLRIELDLVGHQGDPLLAGEICADVLPELGGADPGVRRLDPGRPTDRGARNLSSAIRVWLFKRAKKA